MTKVLLVAQDKGGTAISFWFTPRPSRDVRVQSALPPIMAIPVTIAASEICLIPIHSPPISMQAVEKVHTLSLMRKRAHSDASMRDSAGHRARRSNENALMGTLMGTLWERAQCADAQLLIFQEEMARQPG